MSFRNFFNVVASGFRVRFNEGRGGLVALLIVFNVISWRVLVLLYLKMTACSMFSYSAWVFVLTKFFGNGFAVNVSLLIFAVKKLIYFLRSRKNLISTNKNMSVPTFRKLGVYVIISQ